jgi:transcription antitermination factor NusG
MVQSVEPQLPREQKVQILSGSFRDFIGTVQGELPENGKIRVILTFYGRPMTVQVDREQVKAIR